MDDIKLFDKNEKELETLIQSVRIYDDDIGMEFGIERYTIVLMKIGKQQMMEGIELPNQGKIRTLEENFKNTWEYWKRTPSNKRSWKKKIKKGCLRRTRNLLETKLHSRNLIREINTWAVSLVRYLKWTTEELQQMEQRTVKLIMTHRA